MTILIILLAILYLILKGGNSLPINGCLVLIWLLVFCLVITALPIILQVWGFLSRIM